MIGLRPPQLMVMMAGTVAVTGGLLCALRLPTPRVAALLTGVMGPAMAIVHWRHGPY